MFGVDHFDMIHARFLLGSVSSCAELYKKVYAALKPVGWFEIVDMESGTFSDDGTVKEDSACVLWSQLLAEAFAKFGKPMLPVREYETLLKDTRFTNIHSQIMKRPTHDRPRDSRIKEIGRVRDSSKHVASQSLTFVHSFLA